ncbi:MAG TPA: hypothetical protein VF789_19210 [Thermoanaerobaculia bacterium]
MNKSRKLDRAKVVLVQEKDLRFVKGADERLKQHVDNPGQTAMTDGPP